LHALEEITFRVPDAKREGVLESWRDDAKTCDSQVLSVSSTSHDGPLDIRTAMHYARGRGSAELIDLLQAFNKHVHRNIYHNHVILNVGNADAASRCFRMLGNPGDKFIAEEFSFCGVIYGPVSQGIEWVPTRLDKDGIIPQELENMLQSWDERTQGSRPHVLYTIPFVYNSCFQTAR
jgi:aromatic amino acid aminotransferase I